jgi:SAM-dependent methyltransferase
MIANTEQFDHWNNRDEVGHWLTQRDRYDRMLGVLSDPLFEGARLQAGDRLLDIGCGCGATTRAAAQRVAPGSAVGMDLSKPMLECARGIAADDHITNVSFEAADVQVHLFEPAAFDAVISRFGTMFFSDPVTAFANVRRATRPGGRLAFVSWQPREANEWLVVPGAALAEHLPLPAPAAPGAPGMFAFAEPDRARQVLGDAGWRDIAISPRHVSMLVGGGGTLDDAVEFLRTGSMGRTILAGAEPATATRALASVRDALAPFAGADGVRLGAAVWLVQGAA